jgi:hypothetical protein
MSTYSIDASHLNPDELSAYRDTHKDLEEQTAKKNKVHNREQMDVDNLVFPLSNDNVEKIHENESRDIVTETITPINLQQILLLKIIKVHTTYDEIKIIQIFFTQRI